MKCKVCGQPPKNQSKDTKKFSRKTGYCSIECQEKDRLNEQKRELGGSKHDDAVINDIT
jgi:hypothetical protein